MVQVLLRRARLPSRNRSERFLVASSEIFRVNQAQHNPATDDVLTGGTGEVTERERGYLWLLVGLLMSVTIFEGYDVTIFHLCTPDIAKTFHLDDAAVGTMASLVRVGGMAAFFLVMYSDRVGRKPILSATVLGYTLFTLLTALSQGLATSRCSKAARSSFCQPSSASRSS